MCSRSAITALALTAAGLVLVFGCGKDGGGGPSAAPKPGSDAANSPANADTASKRSAEEDALIEKYKGDLDLPVVHYEWDKNAGDKSVPAELGGPGFTGEGWTTNMEYPAIGDPKAPKGGTIRQYLGDWPATLRIHGEHWNTTFNSALADLCAETLLDVHPTTLDYIPRLATHWKISADRQTFSFRLDPRARFSDGAEVTANDVLASFALRMDPTCRDPGSVVSFSRLDAPVAKSKYIVEVHSKEDNWLNFLNFATFTILPAREVSIPGKEYLDKYQNAFTAMSGRYVVRPADIKMGERLTLSRREDWWGARNPANAGTANVDRFQWDVVKDPQLAFEKVKKGEIDLYIVPKAQWWVEEIPKLEPVQRGLLQMRKIYNDCPQGFGGLALNTKKPPLDDIRVRRALQLLEDRRKYIRNLFYDEYQPLASYSPGPYANPENKVIEFDPLGAVELLEQAGWKDLNDQLYRVKNGSVLQLEVLYDYDLTARYLTLFQTDCQKAGIKLDLKLVTSPSLFKSVQAKEFTMAEIGWVSGPFPDPEPDWHSKYADAPDTNNITSFKSPRVDELLLAYNREYDVKRRVAILQDIDGIIYKDHPYVLNWSLPSIRFLYWNKIGMPAWGCPRTTIRDSFWYTCWVDPEKERALEAAMKDNAKTLPIEERENKFWRAWDAVQRRKEKGAAK